MASEWPKGVNAGIGFENGGHDSGGPYKVLGYAMFTDKFGNNEIIKIDSTHTGDFKELNGVTITFEQPFLDKWSFSLTASHNWSRPGGLTDEFYEQTVHDHSYGGSLDYTFSLSEKSTALLSAGFNSLDSKSKKLSRLRPTAALDTDFLFDEWFDQRTRDLTASIAVQYNPTQDIGIFGAVTLSQGVDWANPASYRIGADDTPTVVTLSGSYTHNLPMAWQVVLKGDLQLTDDRLNQQKMFSIGGSDYATAYKPSEAVGDIGGGVRLELNKVGVTSLTDIGDLYYKPFVFVDAGFTKINDAIAGESSETEKKASIGAGLSLEAANGVHAGVQLSRPLSNGSIFDMGKDESRILVSVGIRK